MNVIPWWRTTFGEETIRKLANAINGEHISQGPITAEFEARLAKSLEVPYVVATNNGSISLLMALMALGIQRDDEVIVPNRTWIATAHAPLMLGAKVVVVDVQPDLPIMDVSNVKQKITSKTKAIMPAHLCGRAANMEIVHEIAEENGLYVIEDACQALFSKNSRGYLGTQSNAGCYSLSVAKLISSGQGGFIVTRNKDVHERLKMIRSHGVADVINVTYTKLGFNFRFTDLQASVALSHLDRVSERIAHVKAVYTKYENEIAEFPFLKLIPVSVLRGEIPLYVEVLCKEREKLIEFLASHNIQTRPFYPNLNRANYLGNGGKFPNSRVFETQGLVLPCGPDQPLENIDRVIKTLKRYK